MRSVRTTYALFETWPDEVVSFCSSRHVSADKRYRRPHVDGPRARENVRRFRVTVTGTVIDGLKRVNFSFSFAPSRPLGRIVISAKSTRGLFRNARVIRVVNTTTICPPKCIIDTKIENSTKNRTSYTSCDQLIEQINVGYPASGVMIPLNINISYKY